MAWSKLSERLVAVPLVLAGPMLRKVTESSVTVWLALKEHADVTLEISRGESPGVVEKLFSGHRPSVRIGPNLHLVAVTAQRGSEKPLATGTVYNYDLMFKTDDGKTRDLLTAVGASGKDAYAYDGKSLPSFALPPEDLEDVRLIQGSCRKPNADGPDALAMLDDMIAASVDSPTGRPHQLLLTGDQIYADEVADVLLLMLTDAASALLVAREPLPGPNGTKFLADMQPPGTRTNRIRDEAKFTTEDTRSHLMSFGEYLAMYLFVWSDVLWPKDIPDPNDLLNALMGSQNDPSVITQLLGDIGKQRPNVEQMRSTVLKVRRALANVPSAMILDDHEITDDWNMTREFCDNVYGSALGMRIIQNGLLAYALCQHWGNAPEQFEKNPSPAGSIPVGVALLNLFSPTANYDDFADQPIVKTVLGLHAPDKLAAHKPAYAVFHDEGTRERIAGCWIDSKSLLYHYSLEAKAYQVIFTDTRTWRAFPRPGKTAPPDMLAKEELIFQIGKTPKLDGRLLLVVVTTNMPPGPTIRQGARDLPTLVKLDGPKHWYDEFYDSWDITNNNFARMLAEISRKFAAPNLGSGGLVLLSGDVHTSSACRITYSATSQVGDQNGSATLAELSIAQFIGSALKNQAEKTIGQHKLGYSYVPAVFKYTINVPELLKQSIILTEGFVGWNSEMTARGLTVGKEDVRSFVKELVSPLLAGGERDYEFDPDFCTRTLRDEELPTIWSKRLLKITMTPHYRIRLDYLKVTDRGSFNRQPKVIKPSDDPLKRSADKARAYEDYISSVHDGREMVGLNNIGEITFIRHENSVVNPKLMARYTVLWRENGMVQLVRYDVSLDVLDKGFKQLPFPT